MNERNKNDTIFHTNSKIMTSTDWKLLNGQLNKHETHWSTNQNKTNGHEKRKENFTQKNYQNYQNDQQSKSRSAMMLNGVENLSRIHHEAEKLAELNNNSKHCMKKNEKKEFLIEHYKTKINKEPLDRVTRLLADSPSSLSYPSYSSYNVSNILDSSNSKMVKNVTNFNISSSFNRTPNRTLSLGESFCDRKLLSNNYDKHIKFSSRNSIDDFNDDLKEFKGTSPKTNLLLNGDYERTFVNRALDNKIAYNQINTRRKVNEFDNPNNFFRSSLNDLPSTNKTFKETRRRDPNLSNTSQHTPISLKKLNLSLPLAKETVNLMENRKLPSTISKNDLKETSKALQNPKYIENRNLSTKDKRFSLNFSPNQPSITLATVQPAFNNRSEFSTLYHHQPSHDDKMVQSAKADKLSTNIELNRLRNDATIRNCSDSLNVKNFDRLIANQRESQLSTKLDSLDSLDLNRLSADLIELRKDVDQFNDELNRVDEKIRTENFLKQEQHRLSTDDLLLKKIDKTDKAVAKGSSQLERPQTAISQLFIDYNAFNLKLNSHLVHLIKHSELDQKSNLLLNLVQEDHSGIIICLGKSTIVNAKCSIGYYIGAITLNSTAQQLLTIGDLVLEINSRPLSLSSSINLEKVNNLMNGYFNLNRYLQLRIVPRTVLMNQFRQSVNDFNDDTIRTVVINAQKRKLSGKNCSFGLTIKGGAEYGLGIFVSNVDKGSLSEQSGIKVGDLIITLNGHDFLNLKHDDAALLIRSTAVLIFRVRNVGFIPLSALLLDQADESKLVRCNSAIEFTDHNRVHFENALKLNRIPIELIKEELKINGLLNRKEVKNYLINKYGSREELKRKKLEKQTNQINRINNLKCDGDNYLDRSAINNLLKNEQRRLIQNNYSNLVPNKLPSSNLPANLLANLDALSDDFLLKYVLNSPKLPLNASSLDVNSQSNSSVLTLPNSLSDTQSDSQLAQLLLANNHKTDLNDCRLENELILDEQLNLLLNANDRLIFNFYKNEYLSNSISLNVLVYSVSRILNTPEKRKLFTYLRPFIPITNQALYNQLILIYDQQNHLLSDDEFNFGKLYRSNSYDDHLMDREHWINTSSFNQVSWFRKSYKCSNFSTQKQDLYNSAIQRDLPNSSAFLSSYFQPSKFLSSQNKSFPFLNKLSSSNYLDNDSQFYSMSPYHYQNQKQTTDSQIDNIQNHSSITSSSSSPYSNTIRQTRAVENCASNPSLSTNVYHVKQSHHIDSNGLTNHYLHTNNMPHFVDANTNYYPSLNNLRNTHNYLDLNEQNQSTPEQEREVLRNSTMNYQNPHLLSNHSVVRRHRSMPADYFQKGLNHYPNKNFADQMHHQRSASFKLPARRAYEKDDDCFRVRINKTKPILGIAIEGGINVPNQILPRIISIHETGSAYVDGQLKVGHIILEINSVSTEGLTHSEIARLLAHSYYTNQDDFIELVIKEKPTDPSFRRNSLLMLNNSYR